MMPSKDQTVKGIASLLKAAVEKGNYDLILTGALADDGAGQVGGMLAAMLDVPYASVVNTIEVLDDKKLKVGREIEGGNQEMNEIDLPCVLSIQTGINEPRYVGIRGIRKVASVEIPVWGASDLGIAADSVGEAGARANGWIILFRSSVKVLRFLKAARKRWPIN